MHKPGRYLPTVLANMNSKVDTYTEVSEAILRLNHCSPTIRYVTLLPYGNKVTDDFVCRLISCWRGCIAF